MLKPLATSSVCFPAKLMINSPPKLDRRAVKFALRLQLFTSLLILILNLVIALFRQSDLTSAILSAIFTVALQWLVVGLYLLKIK